MGTPNAADATGPHETARGEETVEHHNYNDQAPGQAKAFMQHDFGLDRRLIKAVAKMGFVYPTLVQSKCIPLALRGKDLLVRARTGSGKTAAFALPLLQKILRRKEAEPGLSRGVRAVVLVPTRELCEQARSHLSELMHYCRDSVSLLALVDDNMPAQQAALRDRADILVATPARLVAHLKEGNVELKDTVETLVVDEADLVLSFGYSDDIRSVTARLPKICQGFLMSATLSPELEDLKRVVLHSPAVLKLEEGARDGRLAQFYLPVQQKDDKFLVVFAFIKLGLLEGKGLFFVNDTESSYRLKLFLEQFHVRSAVLNAELPLNSRLHILQEFNRGIFDYLIVTDDSMDVKSRKKGRKSEAIETQDVNVPKAAADSMTFSSSLMLEDEDGSEMGDDEDDEDSEMENGQHSDQMDEDQETGDGDGVDGKAGTSNNTDKKRKMQAETDDGQDTQEQNDDPPDDENDDEDDDDVDDDDDDDVDTSNSRGKRRGDGEFGVARGVDFRGVSFVLNVDFPPSEASYTHRVGRTARAGASGTALSLVLVKDPTECRTLQNVQESQPGMAAPSLDGSAAGAGSKSQRESIVASMGAQGSAEQHGGVGVSLGGGGTQAQPAPLAFDIREIERFRYRVEDTLKKVTRVSVREARAAELKAEMLNSERLAGYFKEHAGDLKVLRHDKSILHPLRRLEHLKHIPDYLMPSGLQTGEDPTKRQRKKLKRQRGGAKRRTGLGQDQARRKDNDPLQTFEASELGGQDEGREDETAEDAAKRMNEERKSRVMQTGDFAGESTSGRRRWQQRRGRGQHGGGGKRKPKKKGTRFDLPV